MTFKAVTIAACCILVAMFALLGIRQAHDFHRAPAFTQPVATVANVPIEPSAAQKAAPPWESVPAETAEQKRFRKDCADEKYLAERRKFSDWTANDLKIARACEQNGYWE
jgi:hypothetical protein